VSELLVPFLLLFLVWLALFVWWIARLVEVCTLPESAWVAAGQSRLVYVLLMIFLGWIGTLIWELGPRRQVRLGL